MRELGPPLQSAAMTMLWVNGGAEVTEGRALKTQSLYYASNENVAKPRAKGMRISMIQVIVSGDGNSNRRPKYVAWLWCAFVSQFNVSMCTRCVHGLA